MIVKMMEVGSLMVNCYIVGDEETMEAAVFDPGGNVDQILKVVLDLDLKIKYIINTHSHFDHIGGNHQLQHAAGVPILTHRHEVPPNQPADNSAFQFIEEGEIIELGSVRFEVIDIRGHSPGGLGFIFEGEVETQGERQHMKMVICGDGLFAGSIGRTDFPGGDTDLLLDNIRSKIFTLPDETLVLSGHGAVTTVGREKRYNPFFRQ